MKLKEFIESHDKAVLAIYELKEKILQDKEFEEALENMELIQNHLQLLETDYIDFQEILIEG